MAATRLTAVSEEFVPDRAPLDLSIAAESAPRRAESALMSVLVLSLKTLSAKAVAALAALADLAMIASAFVLWLLIIGGPTPLQLIGVGGYAVFVLIALLVKGNGRR